MDGLVIDVDTAPLLAALDRLASEVVLRHTKAAALVTANRIQAEARARVARRTGLTAQGITVYPTRDGQGYVVMPFNDALERERIAAGYDQTAENLPIWLEFGTKFMAPQPYFFASAKLEENAHDRRMRQAIQDAIDEVGLGE